MQTVRKNIERMVEVVPDTDYQSLQHFVTDSPWDARPVMDQVAKDADSLFEGSLDTGLIIDETSFPNPYLTKQCLRKNKTINISYLAKIDELKCSAIGFCNYLNLLMFCFV